MDKNYTFENFWYDLDQGYQIYFKYLDEKYLISKLTKNCYSQERISSNPKSPHPKLTMLTLKRVKEIFPFMEEIEYKI